MASLRRSDGRPAIRDWSTGAVPDNAGLNACVLFRVRIGRIADIDTKRTFQIREP